MNGSRLLHDARVLVEKGWCQGTEARDSSGLATDVDASNAAEWSLLGALQATAVTDPATQIRDVGAAVAALAEVIVDPSLAGWNDCGERTKHEVVSVLREAEVLAFERSATYEITQN